MLVTLAGPGSWLYTAADPEPETFDYYISTTGSDSNDGSEGSPWAITAINSKRATYAGLRVGIKNGNYDVSAIAAGGGVGGAQSHWPKLAIAPGDASNQTVVQAVNARGAVIHGAGSTGSIGIIGSYTTDTGYITLKNIVVTGGIQHSIVFNREGNNASNQGNGIRVEGCEVREQDYDQADLTIGIFLQGLDDAVVTNCYLHDIHNSAQEASCSGVELYGCRNTEIYENTFADVYYGIYDKYGSGGVEMQGTRVRRNYYASTINTALNGFDNRIQTSEAGDEGPYADYIIENNVFDDVPTVMTGTSNASNAKVLFRFNTIYRTSGVLSGPGLHTQAAGREPSYYCNLNYVDASVTYTGGWRVVTLSTDGAGTALTEVVDYNCYGPGNLEWQTSSPIGDYYSGSYDTYNTTAAWRAATGIDDSGKSLFETDPLFTLTGSNANKFKLQGTSPCLNAGRVGGVSGGATRHIGAWDGVVTQIGCDY